MILTIGHSDLGASAFVRLLKIHEIDVVLDVRSSPFSRRAPQYNRPELAKLLEPASISYAFAGRSLGGRPSDPTLYVSGRVSYARLARSGPFIASIKRIVKLMSQCRIGILCAERDPIECHRFLLIGRALTIRNIDVQHILHDGDLESHFVGEDRLLRATRQNAKAVSEDRGEVLARAYALQESRFAFREPTREADQAHQLSF